MKPSALCLGSGLALLVILVIVAGCTAPSTGNLPATPLPATPAPTVPAGSSCGLTTCHGLDLACGPDAPQVCTMEYRLGDKCRQYARCDNSGGACRLVTDPQFVSCKSYVEQCAAKAGSNGQAAFECEATC
jgi:hypothetical protein